MLRLHPIEFLLRGIPEGFLFIISIYVFSKININNKKCIISSLLYSANAYIIRLLPINYGVHTILSLLFLGVLVVYYNQIDVIKSLRSIIIIFLIQFLAEGVNVLILSAINININSFSNNPLMKSILGIPSLLISYLVVVIFYFINNKKK